MSGPLLLGIDEGSTAVKAALFELDLTPVAEARRGVATAHPRPGFVEQDPELILEAVVDAVAEVLEAAPGRQVAAAGLDHQGESVLAWDAASGRALSPVISWQDKRQERMLKEIDPAVEELTGLPRDPYFSAGKLAWLLDAQPELRSRSVRLGTVDAFISDRLGGRFATDLSTASRTQLLALGGRDWDERLLRHFGLDRAMLPRIGPSFGELGELAHERWGGPLALRAQLVDQQAALAGSGAVDVGQAKATYGTGVFILGRTSQASGAEGLLPTVAWVGPGLGRPAYALDGGVFAAGALLEWLADGLGLARDPPALAAMAATVTDCGGVKLLPALAGLGAPWWEPRAHGVIAGLHAGIAPAHLARAALEGIAHRVADVVEAMSQSIPITGLRVDGGLSNDKSLLQLQADLLGIELLAGRPDATVLGAAMLAGVGAGLYPSLERAAELLDPGSRIAPRIGAEQRLGERRAWLEFAARASAL